MTTPAADLLRAVEAFVREVEGSLDGRQGFHAKVAANALAIVAREIEQRPALAEQAALVTLAGDLPVTEQRARLCAALRDGSMDAATPGLLDALAAATCANLAVDNPRYPTLHRLRGETPPVR